MFPSHFYDICSLSMNSFVGSDGNMNIFSSIDNGHYGALDGLTIVGDE